MASQAPAWWWAVGLLALAQLISFGLIASQHATIQQLRGEAPAAPLGRRLLQAQVGAAPAAPADPCRPLAGRPSAAPHALRDADAHVAHAGH